MTLASIEGSAPGWDGTGHVLALRQAGYWLVGAPHAPPAALDRAVVAGFDPDEQAEYARLAPPARRGRVLGRLAAKAAVRHWLAAPVPLAAIRIAHDSAGRPRAVLPPGMPVPRVSVAHHGPVGVAVAAAGPVGIDVELVADRGPTFARLALTPAELALGAGHDPAEWVTRLWTVKEAVAKAAGTGLQGRPKAIVVDEVDGRWSRAGGRWAHTSREGDLLVTVVAAHS